MTQILIADDSEAFRSQLQQDLVESGYQVTAAADGEHAIRLLNEGKEPQVLILDVNMPGASGIEVIEQCKRKGLLKNAIIFMLTTDTSPELKAAGKALGVRAWIGKPYKKESLLQALQKVLNP